VVRKCFVAAVSESQQAAGYDSGPALAFFEESCKAVDDLIDAHFGHSVSLTSVAMKSNGQRAKSSG
jgi:hypothetical protein